MTAISSWWCEHAWLPGGPAANVRIRCAPDGMIKDVAVGVRPESGDHRLSGLVLPGFANTHVHAFHRALRGRTHGRGGTFWTWRDNVRARRQARPRHLRRARDRRLRGDGAGGHHLVGEFHYLHHGPGGARTPTRTRWGRRSGRPRGRRHPAHPAGHVLPARRHRRAARGRAAPVRRPGRRELGGPGGHVERTTRTPRRRRGALRPGGAGGGARRRGRGRRR